MTDICIRSANSNDIDTLFKFEQSIISAERPYDKALRSNPISYYDLKEFILSETTEVLVAEINYKIIGSGYAQIRKSQPYLKHDYHSYLGLMFVDPSYRGKGVNKLILNSLKEWSKNQNVHHMSLDVYDGNKIAIRAYEKAGFKKNIIEMCVSID